LGKFDLECVLAVRPFIIELLTDSVHLSINFRKS
jgi:hypothetical protein